MSYAEYTHKRMNVLQAYVYGLVTWFEAKYQLTLLHVEYSNRPFWMA